MVATKDVTPGLGTEGHEETTAGTDVGDTLAGSGYCVDVGGLGRSPMGRSPSRLAGDGAPERAPSLFRHCWAVPVGQGPTQRPGLVLVWVPAEPPCQCVECRLAADRRRRGGPACL